MLFTLATIVLAIIFPSNVWAQISEVSPPEDFVAAIHYSGDGCMEGAAVSVHTAVTNEISNVTGGTDGSISGVCGYETTCMHDGGSPLCIDELKQSVVVGEIFITMNDHKVLVECDTTNDPKIHGKCFIVEGCKSSSLLPSCTYRTYAASTLYRHPELIYNPNAVSAGLDRTTYMVFYEDPSCTETVALDGIVTGRADVSIVENIGKLHTCADAMNCFINPGGDYCKLNVNESDKRDHTIYSETRNEGRDVYQCDDNNGTNCQQVSDECAQSPVPSCYYRWVSGVELFTNPGTYLLAENVTRANNDDENTSNNDQESDAHALLTSIRAVLIVIPLIGTLYFV